MEACVSPAHRRQLPEKWEASPVARQRLGRGAVTSVRFTFCSVGSGVAIRQTVWRNQWQIDRDARNRVHRQFAGRKARFVWRECVNELDADEGLSNVKRVIDPESP